MKPWPGSVVLLDARESYERQLAAIELSLHLLKNDVPDRVEGIPRDRQADVDCHNGHRSMIMAAFRDASGFPSMANLSGGIDAWSVLVDPGIPRYPWPDRSRGSPPTPTG